MSRKPTPPRSARVRRPRGRSSAARAAVLAGALVLWPPTSTTAPAGAAPAPAEPLPPSAWVPTVVPTPGFDCHASDLDSAGRVVGTLVPTGESRSDGFVAEPSATGFTVTVPGSATPTRFRAVNEQGLVVGDDLSTGAVVGYDIANAQWAPVGPTGVAARAIDVTDVGTILAVVPNGASGQAERWTPDGGGGWQRQSLPTELAHPVAMNAAGTAVGEDASGIEVIAVLADGSIMRMVGGEGTGISPRAGVGVIDAAGDVAAYTFSLSHASAEVWSTSTGDQTTVFSGLADASRATALNNSGTVVGLLTTNWFDSNAEQPPQAIVSTLAHGLELLPPPGGATDAWPVAVNGGDIVLGQAYGVGGPEHPICVVWHRSAPAPTVEVVPPGPANGDVSPPWRVWTFPQGEARWCVTTDVSEAGTVIGTRFDESRGAGQAEPFAAVPVGQHLDLRELPAPGGARYPLLAAVNDLGVAVGSSDFQSGPPSAVAVGTNTWTPLGAEADLGGIAFDVNETGTILGTASWHGDDAARLWAPTGAGWLEAPLPAAVWRPASINDRGEVAARSPYGSLVVYDTTTGAASFLPLGTVGYHIRTNGDQLSTSGGSMNDRGDVAVDQLDTRWTGAVWESRLARVRMLERPAWATDTHAAAINDLGLVGGSGSTVPGAGRITRPLVWDADGHVTELPLPPGEVSGSVAAINDTGTIVGSAGRHCALWTQGALPELLPRALPVVVTPAFTG